MKKLVTLFIILLGVQAIHAQKVKVAADPSVNLANYKTYGWAKGAAAANPIVNQLIVDSIDQALTAKGMTRVTDEPDITIVVWAAMNTDLHISYPTWGRSASSATATGVYVGSQGSAIPKGTLVVDISDARTKSTVWRATASQTLAQDPSGDMVRDAKAAEKGIRRSVEKMFKRYPVPN